MTATTEFGLPTVVVTPGQETRTTMTVRNDSDIVEAYTFEVVGECAPWTEVEPGRLSLYPGASGQVTVVLRPPRSPDVRAGEKPLGIQVLPTERPDAVSVSETMVVVEPFAEQRAELVPERRRAWRRARYVVALHNDGNTPVAVMLSAPQTDDQLSYTFPARPVSVEPGDRAELDVRARVGKILWFGKPVTWALRIDATADETQHPLDGELIQLSVFPKWLLAVLAALLALIVAWFLLVRPAVQSAAREAADDRAQEVAKAAAEKAVEAQAPPAGGGGGGGGQQQQQGGQEQAGQQGNQGQAQQSSGTIEVRTNTGDLGTGTYVVPAGKVFRITDLVLANHQGDEGVLTIRFGDQTITTIALETFRNQDYHWVTPVDVPAGSSVSATVSCARPGTPATGRQAPNCFQVLNVSGQLADQG